MEYDRDGRLHYIPKSISRSASHDRHDDQNSVTAADGGSSQTNSSIDGEENNFKHSRSASNGKSILS